MIRSIVRDGNVLSGRWRFDGTTIPIAAIRSDFQFGREETKAQYKFMELTDAEIDAVMDFSFPDIRERGLVVDYASLTMQCVCGEDTHKAMIAPMQELIHCICGREWLITIATVLANSGEGASFLDATG
jgi:uncharacterized protein (DUF433 family)